MKHSLARWLWSVMAGVILIAGVSIAARYSFAATTARSSDDFGPAPSFSSIGLTNEANRPVTTGDLTGKTLLVSFIYTSCPDICSLTTKRMAAVQELVQKESALKQRVHLLSVSVDPVHDTPEVLAAYAKENGADPALWSFLTGPSDQVRQLVVDGFHLGLETTATQVNAATGQPLITHSDRVVLIDSNGRIRAMYHADELDPSQVLDALRKL